MKTDREQGTVTGMMNAIAATMNHSPRYSGFRT